VPELIIGLATIHGPKLYPGFQGRMNAGRTEQKLIDKHLPTGYIYHKDPKTGSEKIPTTMTIPY
jgi:hypothetical protein